MPVAPYPRRALAGQRGSPSSLHSRGRPPFPICSPHQIRPLHQGMVNFMAIAHIEATRTSHLTREDTGRNVVHADLYAWTAELLRKQLAELDGCRLRHVVLEVVLRCACDARDGRDVDDRARVASDTLRCGAEQWKECDGREKVPMSNCQLSTLSTRLEV